MDNEPSSGAGRALRDFYTWPAWMAIGIPVVLSGFWRGVIACSIAGAAIGLITVTRTWIDTRAREAILPGAIYFTVYGAAMTALFGLATCGIGLLIRRMI